MKTALSAIVLSLAFIVSADAAPPIGDWVEIPGTLSPPGSPETVSFWEAPRSGVTTVGVRFLCDSPSCEITTTTVVEPVPNVFVAGPFPAGSTPKRYFMFLQNQVCTDRFGPTVYLGMWTDTGSAPYIAACYTPRRLNYIPRNLRPQPITPPNVPQFRMPPLTVHPAPIGPGPHPGPTPPH